MKSIQSAAKLLFAVTIGAGIVHASGPIAVYALVDKVTFEPNGEKPERVRIDGVFAVAEGRTSTYSAPQRGFLYFTLPPNNRETALREWSDLKTVAGTRQVVGLGSSFYMKMRIRKPDEQPGSADEYTMGNGLIKVNADHPNAKALLDHKER